MKLYKKVIIRGCDDSRGGTTPYLTRWRLLESRFGACYLHLFHRSDEGPELHDHPWPFLSVILWRGYNELTPCEFCDGTGNVDWHPWDGGPTEQWGCEVCDGAGTRSKRIWPGQIIFRPATWKHRVELINKKPTVTFVIRGAYRRIWGFWTKQGWQDFRDYFKENGCEPAEEAKF